jgi:hypothetical protein
MDWLPVKGLRRPVKSNQPNSPQLVSELIDMSTVSWDKAKLLQWFSLSDVEAITNISLSTRHQDDYWAWFHEKSGVFSVRTAYRMLITDRSLENRTCRSNISVEEKEWTTLWGIKVPSKIRVFLWRLARSSLPSKDVLHHKHMADNNACSICGAADSWRHSLIECNMARCVWALEDEAITEHICENPAQDPKSWLVAMMSSLSQEELVRVSVTLWAIWYARRKQPMNRSFRAHYLLTSLCPDFYVSSINHVLREQKLRRHEGDLLPGFHHRRTCRRSMSTPLYQRILGSVGSGNSKRRIR